jgi:RNA polymerase sigma factor (sigma-70 family)
MTPRASTRAAENFPLLLSAARQGCRDALGSLLEMSRQHLLARVRFPTKYQTKIDALDLVQETFVKAVRRFVNFQGETRPAWLAWLRSILRRILVSTCRRYRQAKRDISQERSLERTPVFLQPSSPGHEGEDMLVGAEDAMMMFIVRTLYPEKYQTIIQLRMEDQLGFAEIGLRLGCSEQAARKLWARVGKMIYQEFVRFHDFEPTEDVSLAPGQVQQSATAPSAVG